MRCRPQNAVGSRVTESEKPKNRQVSMYHVQCGAKIDPMRKGASLVKHKDIGTRHDVALLLTCLASRRSRHKRSGAPGPPTLTLWCRTDFWKEFITNKLLMLSILYIKKTRYSYFKHVHVSIKNNTFLTRFCFVQSFTIIKAQLYWALFLSWTDAGSNIFSNNAYFDIHKNCEFQHFYWIRFNLLFKIYIENRIQLFHCFRIFSLRVIVWKISRHRLQKM